MIYDEEIRKRQIYLRSIAPKNPAQWTTRKPTSPAGDPNLLTRALEMANRQNKKAPETIKKTCPVCGSIFYTWKNNKLCFECTQWANNEHKCNKKQLNLFNQ